MVGQSNDTWNAFWNKDTTLIGYKDKNGTIKIKPKFQTGFTIANKFDNIIAVAEDVRKSSKYYYLTKSGRIIGRDSIHFFDNGADCENEGFIRFRDSKTDRVGLFNRNGDIVIPAQYNEVTRVRNGMMIALKGATKKYWAGGEHYSWAGGKEILIDTANNTLVDSFKYSGNLNYFSLLISTQPNPDTIRQNFKTTGRKYFSFMNFDKEFSAWLNTLLLTDLTKDILLNAAYKEVTYWKEPGGWRTEAKNNFFDRNYELIKAKLLQLRSTGCDYSIFDEGLNPYIYGSAEYKEYFNNCGESRDWVYPVKNIVISYGDNKNIVQDHIEFLRTDDGYKLISVAISKGEIK